MDGYAKLICAVTYNYSVTLSVAGQKMTTQTFTAIRLGNDMRVIFPYYAQFTLPEATTLNEADAIAELVLEIGKAENGRTDLEIDLVNRGNTFDANGQPILTPIWTAKDGQVVASTK